MKLYFDPMSQPSRAVQWFILNHKLNIEFSVISLQKKEHLTEEYTKKSRFQSVPILELDDGSIVTESTTILQYLAELNKIEAEYPTADLMKKTRVNEAMAHHESLARQVTHLMVRVQVMAIYGVPQEKIVELLKEKAPELKYYMGLLDDIFSSHKFAAGDFWSIADYLYVSEINQLEILGPLIYHPIKEQAVSLAAFPNVQRYMEDAKKQEGYAGSEAAVHGIANLMKAMAANAAAAGEKKE